MKFVDLFCGIGTIRMGMEQAGHECVYSVEWDKHKRKIYSIIFGGEPEGADIWAVRPSDIPRADIWTFGAPCQDFSIAGKRAGMEGERSSLVLEVFRLVRETPEEDRPKYLLYENVKGMLSSSGGRDFLGILSEMESLGYDIEWQLLNSKNFGVPQNRERVYTIGHSRRKSTRKIFPITGNNGETLKQLVGGSQGVRVYDPSGVSCTLAAEAGGLGAKTGLYFIDLSTQEAKVTDHARCLQARYNKGYSHRKGETSGVLDVRGGPITRCESAIRSYEKFIEKNGYIPELFNPYNCAEIKDVAPTLTTMCDRINSSSTVLKSDGYRIRKLTPKECWRLQVVPDEITNKAITAGISDSQMYRGAGDACTVNVIHEIAKKLI